MQSKNQRRDLCLVSPTLRLPCVPNSFKPDPTPAQRQHSRRRAVQSLIHTHSVEERFGHTRPRRAGNASQDAKHLRSRRRNIGRALGHHAATNAAHSRAKLVHRSSYPTQE
eukprot:2726023-Pleurochrysis_carterae.AAC.1